MLLFLVQYKIDKEHCLKRMLYQRQKIIKARGMLHYLENGNIFYLR